MKNLKLKIISGLVILITLVFLSGASFEAKAQNFNRELRQKIFVHYPKPQPAKPPAGSACTVTGSDQVNDYLLAGWQMPTEGMIYKISTITAPKEIQAVVGPAIESAFSIWTATDSSQIFINGGQTEVRTAKLDGENIIVWRGMNPSIIAVTYVWYWADTGELVEADTMFNKNLPWAVSPYTTDCIASQAYDVQNIATHEFGHWVGLDDWYAEVDSELTMYGYGALGELKKDTLGKGDISGVLAVGP